MYFVHLLYGLSADSVLFLYLDNTCGLIISYGQAQVTNQSLRQKKIYVRIKRRRGTKSQKASTWYSNEIDFSCCLFVLSQKNSTGDNYADSNLIVLIWRQRQWLLRLWSVYFQR